MPSRLFSHYIGIDWSGADADDKPVKLRIAKATAESTAAVVRSRRKSGNWTRSECLAWLSRQLSTSAPRSLVAMDFGFSLPFGSDRAVFACDGWHQMLQRVDSAYITADTARRTATNINDQSEFVGHGPYRFNESRTDFRFYRDNGVAYYRAVELAVPQAISEWYMGSGGTVGYHTITGMSALHRLMKLRESGAVDFEVWPYECSIPSGDKHVIVECYPSLFKSQPEHVGSPDELDALKVADWLRKEDATGTMGSYFRIKPLPFGRIEGVSFEDQIRFEGWIIGVK